MTQTPHPLDRACLSVGGRKQLAERLNVTPAAIGNWKARGVPVEYCPAIERETSGEVTRRDLRPGDFHLIWPELSKTPTNEEVRNAA